MAYLVSYYYNMHVIYIYIHAVCGTRDDRARCTINIYIMWLGCWYYYKDTLEKKKKYVYC